jgi:hypothetical protein
MTNREPCSRWANEGSNVWLPSVGSQRHAPEPKHRLCTASHRRSPQMILLSHEFLSHQQTFGTTPTACIRFAVFSRIEILHILLEHSYDSQRNENAGSARPLHRRQPVARSQDLLSPLRQFQRRVAVVGSVAHRVAKDPGGLLAMSRGGDRGKVYTRDVQEAISQMAAAATGRCSCGIGRRRSNRLPVD